MASQEKDPLRLIAQFSQCLLFHVSILLICLSTFRISVTGEGWDSLAFGLFSLLTWKLGELTLTKMKEWDNEIAQRRLDEDDQE